MPSELQEFNDWVNYQKATTGNKHRYLSEGFIAQEDLPKLPAVNQQWKPEDQSTLYNTNNNSQRDVVVSFSIYHNAIKNRAYNRLRSFQLMRKKAALVATSGGIVDRAVDTVNETLQA